MKQWRFYPSVEDWPSDRSYKWEYPTMEVGINYMTINILSTLTSHYGLKTLHCNPHKYVNNGWHVRWTVNLYSFWYARRADLNISHNTNFSNSLWEQEPACSEVLVLPKSLLCELQCALAKRKYEQSVIHEEICGNSLDGLESLRW